MRKNLLRFFVAALLAVMLTSCAGVLTWVAYRHDPQGPQIAGTFELPGLTEPVEVIRDRWAIPHIFADAETDLMRAMGYIHAQDRLFQMDLFRRIIEGKLAEVLGDIPLDSVMSLGGKSTVEQDMGMRILGFEHSAAIFAEMLPPAERALFEAYAQGVNAFIAQHADDLPVEFGLLGYEPTPWEVKDSIAMARFISWGLASNYPLELMRAAADNTVGAGSGEKLLPPFSMQSTRILPDYKLKRKSFPLPFNRTPLTGLTSEELSNQTIYALLHNRGGRTIEASNNWTVDGSRSLSGKPLLANDPHLTHLAPSFFHLIHLAGAGYDTIGASFPGVPFVILGHNRGLAWAVTNCQADVQDLYLHKVDPLHPERYLYKDTWEDFIVREETVQVKEGTHLRPEKINVRVSRFGPVVTDLVNPDRSRDVLSLRWVGMDFADDPDLFWRLEQAGSFKERKELAHEHAGQRGDDITALRQLNRGRSCDDFFQALTYLGSPRQNWICADAGGAIGYVAAGLIPVRNSGDGTRIARAWKDEGRWIGFIPFADLPQARNPKRGYIVSANNETMDMSAYPYPWSDSFVPGDRATRIAEMIEERARLDVADFSRIQGDRLSGQAKRFKPLFIAAAKGDEALTDARLVLARWDDVAAAASAGAALFSVALDHLMRAVMADEMGEDLFFQLTHSQFSHGILTEIAMNKKSPLHDSVKSKRKETWELSYRRALSAAYAELQRRLGPDPSLWRWGALHTMTARHPLGGDTRLAGDLNLGPHPFGGGSDTVWASFYSVGANDYDTNCGPVYRHVVDMARPHHGWFVLDSGNWGQPLTEHYDDLHELWLANKLIPGYLNREDIQDNVAGVLTLAPVDLP